MMSSLSLLSKVVIFIKSSCVTAACDTCFDNFDDFRSFFSIVHCQSSLFIAA